MPASSARRIAGITALLVIGIALGWILASSPPLIPIFGGQINTQVDRSLMPAGQIEGSFDVTCPSPSAAGECGP